MSKVRFALTGLAVLFALGAWSAVRFKTANAQNTGYEKLKAEAEQKYAEKSFALARESYLKALESSPPPDQIRWVKFRLADTLWRAEAGTQTSDSSKFDQALRELTELVQTPMRPEERDAVWAETQESLGDYWWTRRETRNWYQAWQHYAQALDWWAGSSDIETARKRYVAVIFKAAETNWGEDYSYYTYYGNTIPLPFLENALKISQDDKDKAHLHYLIGMTLRHQGGTWNIRKRAPEEFEAALKFGKSTEWYDDALYHYAEWLKSYGMAVRRPNGAWETEYDYVKALELYRRITREFQKGETRYFDSAKNAIDEIVRPVVGVNVSNFFLPDSEIQYVLNWRNVKNINLALYKIGLTNDVRFSTDGGGDWLHKIDLSGKQPVKSWTKAVTDKGNHKPGQETVRFEEKLAPGAYLLVGESGSAKARELLLVTDTVLVVRTSGKQILTYFCNVLTGAPVGGATIRLWRSYYDNQWIWVESAKQSDKDGLALFDVPENQSNGSLFVFADGDGRQAFSTGHPVRNTSENEKWRILALTDRPAYRPSETVNWKFVVRQLDNDMYSTPSGRTVEYQINDPKGVKVKEGKEKLNAFGSCWGSLELTESMPLGEFTVSFWDEGRQHGIGSAKLFRLEEYKLPEFKVSVSIPEENGKRKTYRVGESVQATIQADYYFGGPVADATVQVQVYQTPYYHYWQPPREFPWFFEDSQNRRNWYGGGSVIKSEQLKTDATGQATITFDTPEYQNQDFEYRIEARVTDSSRREIVGSDVVRVTQQRFYVHPKPERYVYRPQETVKIDFKAEDANSQPVQTEGTVKVFRDYWYEIWIDPAGREIKGDELKAVRKSLPVFPPPPAKDEKPWQLKFRGYEHEDILTRKIKTDVEGKAELSFTPVREGYFRVAWTSEDKDDVPVQAETSVWVAATSTTDIGFQAGGLGILLDKDTIKVGQTASVLLTAPKEDVYVLFTVEGESLMRHELIHMTGTVKLVELPIEAKHVPNVFLSAMAVSDRQLFADSKELVVPPVGQFLNVDVKADRDEYQARQEGTLTVTTRDHAGKPVSAEVALGLADESVAYIQEDYAGDPRQFFFGKKRQNPTYPQSSFNQKQFIRLVEGKNNELLDERQTQAPKPSVFGDIRDGVSSLNPSELVYTMPGVVNPGRNEFHSGLRAAAEADYKVVDQERGAFRELSKDDSLAGKKEERKQQGQDSAVVVRSDFRSTAFWQPDVVTDAQGRAVVKVKYPDSLTSWKTTARAVTPTTQVGIGTATTRTKQPLIVRLQAPRFFVVGDITTVSAVVNNNTSQPLTVSPAIEASGLTVTGIVVDGKFVKGEQGPIRVPAGGETRADWVVFAQNPGKAKVKTSGRAGTLADAMEREFTVHEHGIEKFVSQSGKLPGDDVSVYLNIPAERKPETTQLTVQVAPSIAVTMLDALPYLIEYPYGCTEQTMSRFLPTVVTLKTLRDQGLKPEDVAGKVFGGIDTEFAGKTHSRGPQDLNRLNDMTKQGLARLYDFQHSDGGWGWWKDGESDHYMTAYVVWGLSLARKADVEVRQDVLQRGVDFLDKEIVEQEANPDLQAWMLHAISAFYGPTDHVEPNSFHAKAFANLWLNREKLNAYSRALLALSAKNFGHNNKAKVVVENLLNGVKVDASPNTSVVLKNAGDANPGVMSTAHWGADGIAWRWSEGAVESTSFVLRALLAVDQQNKLIEPTVNWLVKNRRGTQWSNTRDTAITVLALNDYLRVSREVEANAEYTLTVNGHPIASKKVTSAEVFKSPTRFDINQGFIRDGRNEIRIVRTNGKSPLYFTTVAQFFSLEEPIPAAGNEIFVRREYYKLVSRPTLLKGIVFDRQPLRDNETVTSGDRVEVVLTVEAKNDYEYLVFEDLKPAGLEAVQVKSGASVYAREVKSAQISAPSGIRLDGDYTGRTRWVYQELRDRKVAMFIDKLKQGVWELRYELRAEVPGAFHVLPVLGHAMYVPEIRCNGEEIRIKVEDRK